MAAARLLASALADAFELRAQIRREGGHAGAVGAERGALRFAPSSDEANRALVPEAIGVKAGSPCILRRRHSCESLTAGRGRWRRKIFRTRKKARIYSLSQKES